MNLIRVNIPIVLLTLICGTWSAVAAEPRDSTSAGKKDRKKQRIIQVVNEEVASPTLADDSETKEKEIESDQAFIPTMNPAGRTWTLKELESIANTIHPALQRDIARIDSARGDALQASLYPNPHFDTNNPQVFTGQNTLLNAGIMQEFVVKGKKRLDHAAAIKVVQQSEFAYVQDRFTLLTALRQQYYTVVAAKRRVEALQKLRIVTSSSVQSGKQLEERAGEVAPIDVYVLEIDNQRVEAELENRIRLLRGARNQLAAIVGDQSIQDDNFEGSLYASPPQYDEKTLNQFVSINSAPVAIQKLEIERNEILLKRAIVEPYPNVTLGPATQWGLQNGGQQYWLTVTFPIPAWDRNQGNIQSQRADLIASRMNLSSLQLEQLRRVADAYSRHRAVRIQAAKYEKDIIPNTLKTLKLARIGYRKGEYDFPRYLQVQRTFVEVNMAYIDLLENVWTSAAELSGLLQLEEFQ